MLCAAYLDGVAAISEDPALAKDTIAAIPKSLASENLDTGDKDETTHIFTGLVFQQETGRIAVPSKRRWKLRLARCSTRPRGGT